MYNLNTINKPEEPLFTVVAYFFLIVFVVLSYVLLTFSLPFAVVLFSYLLIVSLYPLFRSAHIHRHDRAKYAIATVFIMSVAGIYIFFRSMIVSNELWADEFRIINVARLPFEYIAQEAMIQHVGALPLDYWIMHFVDMLVRMSPVQYHEFLYRIPYMAYHIFASVLFGLSVEAVVIRKQLASDIRRAAFSLAMPFYFFFPPLFIFSVEVKFYALSVLGVVLCIYLFITKRISNIVWFPILLLFCLSSPQNYIVLGVLGVLYIVLPSTSGADRKNVLILLVSMIAMSLFWYGRTNTGLRVEPSVVTNSIRDNARILSGLLFDSKFSILLLASVFVATLVYARKWAGTFFSVFVLCVSIIVVLGYLYRYEYVGIRHILFSFPFFLMGLVSPIWSQTTSKRMVLCAVVYTFLIFQWAFVSMYLLKNPFSKDVTGIKKTVQIAKSIGSPILMICDVRNNDNCYYINEVFSWYTNEYNMETDFISTDHTEDKSDDCSYILTFRVLYVVDDWSKCLLDYSKHDLQSYHGAEAFVMD